MANIINESNHLEYEILQKQKKFKERFKKVMLLLLVILVILYFINPYSSTVLIPITVIFLMPFSIFIYAINNRKDEKLVSGLEGEQRALEVLRLLGPEYTVISDLEIEVDKQTTGQMDSIIIGPNGIFIMETKNIKGHVVGNDTDREIIIYKEGRGGGQYSVSHYNPCKQVSGHVYKLSQLLRQEGMNPWIQGIVFFSNMETTIEFETTKVPVFCFSEQGAYLVRQYIINYNKGKRLSTQEQKRIVNILSKYIMEVPEL